MVSNIGDSVNVPGFATSYSGNLGSFRCSFTMGSDWRSNSWLTCREQFHGIFNIRKEFFYWVCPDMKAQAAFISLLEDWFNIKPKCRTRINPVEDGTINGRTTIRITPAPFWMENNTRLCFFTVFLKATYNRKTASRKVLLNSLLRTKYCKNTPRATALFLTGRTQLEKRECKNWVDEFNHVRPTRLKFPKDKSHFIDKNPKVELKQKEKDKLIALVKKREPTISRYSSTGSFTYRRYRPVKKLRKFDLSKSC